MEENIDMMSNRTNYNNEQRSASSNVENNGENKTTENSHLNQTVAENYNKERNRTIIKCGPTTAECYEPIKHEYYCVCRCDLSWRHPDLTCEQQDLGEKNEYRPIPLIVQDQHNITFKTNYIDPTPNSTDTSSRNSNSVKISPDTSQVFIIIFSSAIILLLIAVFWILHRKSNRKATLKRVAEGIILSERSPQYEPADAPTEQILSAVRLIERSAITDLQAVGEGFFGKVYRGHLHFINNGVEQIETVAVKVLKRTTCAEAEADFMREVEMMSSFKHENILSLTGFCPRDYANAPWIVFEYMFYGDLTTVLRNNIQKSRLNNIGSQQLFLSLESLLSFALQIVKGMEYLAERHYIHRDLASRNCLIGSGLNVKIADFGMCRDVYTCDYYRIESSARMLPVRWMAPESILYYHFSSETDIWSYGVVLWEIYSYGKQPYYGYSNEEVVKLISGGELLDIPEECPHEIAQTMLECWHEDPNERIRFSEIRSRLGKMKDTSAKSSPEVNLVDFELNGNETDTGNEDSIKSLDDITNDFFEGLDRDKRH